MPQNTYRYDFKYNFCDKVQTLGTVQFEKIGLNYFHPKSHAAVSQVTQRPMVIQLWTFHGV